MLSWIRRGSFLLGVLPCSLVVKGHTLRELYMELTWSLHAADAGKHPYFDSAGNPVTGWRALVAGKPISDGWQLSFDSQEGDWKYTKEAYYLNAYGHKSCCHLCRATKDLTMKPKLKGVNSDLPLPRKVNSDLPLPLSELGLTTPP